MAGATPLGNMVIKLGLDDADFGRGVANSKKQVSYLAKEMSANMKIADMAGNKLGKLGTRYDGLTKIIGAQENQVKDLKKAYEDSFVDGKATEQTKRLAAQLQDANGKLANYKLQLQQTADAMAEYKIKNEGFTGAVNKASDSLIKSGSALKDFGGKVSSIGSTMTKAVTLPVVAGFGYATKAASDFTTQIGEIGPLLTNGGEVTEEYRKQLDKMSESSKQWSKTYGVATSEINNGLAEVVRKGYDANQTMGVMPSILDATKASGEQFNDVMNVTTEVISQFNLKGKTYEETLKNATMVTDGLTYVANATSAGFVDLGSAMSFVGPVANSLGMSVEETASAIGLLSDAGIGGEKAGTALRGALTRLLKPSKQNIEGFDKLGISVNDFKDGSLTLPDILDKIKKNTNGWTDAQRTAAIALAFGTESQSAMNVLVGQGGKALRDLTKDTKGATGATKDIAKSMNDLPANKVARFKESLNVLAITLGEKLLPIVTPWVEKATDMVNSFSELDEATQKNIIKWGLMAAAAGPALKLLGGGASVVGGLATTTGKLGKSFVGLSAEMAKKKAITEVTEAFIAGNVSAGDLMGTLGGGIGTVGKFGGAAATASGPAGLGAMMSVLGPLTPAILGVVGVGGALAIGYGAWKLWGEEAYNSAQRTKEWGIDVGKATGEALTIVKSNTQEANGEWALLEQGVDGNSAKMIANFEAVGKAIETDLVNQINTFKEAVNLMPEEVQKSAQEIVDGFAEEREKALKIVEENNDAVLEIKKKYTDESGNVTAQGAKMISDLMKQSTSEYLKITIKDADQRKKVLDSMTGDVESASEDQAKTWLQNLGKQREETKNEYNNNLKDFKKYLKDKGQLDTDEGQQLVKLFEKSAEDSTLAIDKQMALISEKYPELKKKVIYENGMLASELGGMAEVTEEANNILLEKAGAMSEKLANNSKKTADTLKWVADQGTDAGKAWNSLELLDKEGKVKSNAAEIVTEATKNTQKWNDIRLVLHDADLDSNAKKVVGEAAIANGWWDGMAWEDKEAVLQDEFSINMYKALDSSGKWQEMSLEEKKAILYSDTPEVMAETMLKLGLWDDYEAEIKDLDADNFNLLKTVSQSEKSLKTYNNLDPDFKELLAKDPSTMTFNESKKALEEYNKLDEDFKKLLGENTNVNNVISKAEEKLNAYEEFKPGPKRLAGDASSVTSATSKGGSNLDNYSLNNPGLKMLRGDESSVRSAAQIGGRALSTYSRNNPNRKYLNATDNASGPAWDAIRAVKNFGRQGDKKVTLTSITKNITQWITEKFTKNATGTNYHPGGLAMVNDQRGAMYRELVQHPTGEMYIPQGRNVMLDLPRGSKVYTAAQTKQMVPKYAEGVGIPKNSTLVRNLESVNSRNIESTTVIQNDNRELVSLMRQMLNTIARLKPAINVNAQGTIADMDLRNISQDLAFLTQIEKGGLNG